MKRLLFAAILMGATAPILFAETSPVIHKILIKQFLFNPHVTIVKSGDEIEFVNDDYAPHTATAADKSFDTNQLNKNGTSRIVAGKPGTYTFGCRFHPKMNGTIIVQ